jgi:hypothetical protein
LSAKYGFLPPDSVIPGPYNVSFKKKATNPISLTVLQDQIRDQGLHEFAIVVGLGGRKYREIVAQAFTSLPVSVHFPFTGLPIGKAMQATKQAVRSGVFKV